MSERERTTQFLKWAKYNIPYTFVVECKLTKANSVAYAALAPHQEVALMIASSGVMNHKIADGSGMQTPFDAFQVSQVPAYVVVFWYVKPKDQRFTLIPIDNWILEKSKGGRKSLTYDRSCQIGRCLSL